MKNRRGSVLCRCTWYMAHPGSLRECSVNFPRTAATSASCPTFAIQVTANTTIACSFPTAEGEPGRAILGFFCGYLQLRNKVVHQDGVVAVGPGRNHPYLRPRFFPPECQIGARLLGKFVVCGNALGRCLPPWHVLIDAFDVLVAAGLCRCLNRRLSVDFVPDAHRDLRQVVEHIKLRD